MPNAENDAVHRVKLRGINQNIELKDAKMETAKLGDNSLWDSCDMYWLRNIDYS